MKFLNITRARSTGYYYSLKKKINDHDSTPNFKSIIMFRTKVEKRKKF